MTISLIELNLQNWTGFADLEVHESQANFIASNAFTIAQSKFQPNLTVKGITAGEDKVGFVGYYPETGFHPEGHENVSYILRFMIDKNQQGKGYGKKAMQQLLKELKALNPKMMAVHLTVVPENKQAISFYKRLGFSPTGRERGGEDEYSLKM